MSLRCIACGVETVEYFRDAELTVPFPLSTVRVVVDLATATRPSGMITDEVCRRCVGVVLRELVNALRDSEQPLTRVRRGYGRPERHPLPCWRCVFCGCDRNFLDQTQCMDCHKPRSFAST